jgi:Suppressor of fused protein (SUFU)
VYLSRISSLPAAVLSLTICCASIGFGQIGDKDLKAEPETVNQRFFRAMRDKEIDFVIDSLESPSQELQTQVLIDSRGKIRVVLKACQCGLVEVIDWLMAHEFPVDYEEGAPKLLERPLDAAIRCGHPAIAERLLTHGAKVRGGPRYLLGAVAARNPEHRILFVELLVKHGADVNEVFDWMGDRNLLFTALEHTSDKEVKEYLRSIGAKTVAELRAEGKLPPAESPNAKKQLPAEQLRQEVIEFFTNQFGPVNKKSLVELVPEEFPVVIHAIPPTQFRQTTILFTTGLSQKPMTLPKDFPASADYQYGELYIEIPADWKFDALEDPKLNWPIKSLRWLAKFPHLTGGWLGYPVAVVDNGEPPTALAPNFAADGLLLFADENFKSSAGHLVHLYRVMPIFAEERKLEKRKGYEALLQALDKAGVKHSVDIQRKPAVR